MAMKVFFNQFSKVVFRQGAGKYLYRSNTNTYTRSTHIRKLCSSITSSLNEEITTKNVVQMWQKKLEEANVPEAETSLNHILASVLNVSHDSCKLTSDIKLDSEQLARAESMILCRLSRVPVQYIIKEWDFLDLTLKMMPPVFIPRPETESLVVLASEGVSRGENEASCLEIGCGSGAISLALLKQHPNMKFTAIDPNPLAVALTRANAELLDLDSRLQVIQASLEDTGFKPDKIPDQKYDLIISNPPYIPTGEIENLAPEIKLYEDWRALDGGPDGFKIVNNILKIAPKILKPGGVVALEVDPRHTELIERESSGFSSVTCHEDCFGVKRLVLIKM